MSAPADPFALRLPPYALDRYMCRACGKFSYTSRRRARRAMRFFHPGDRQLRAYGCPVGHDYHYGHGFHSRRLRPRKDQSSMMYRSLLSTLEVDR